MIVKEIFSDSIPALSIHDSAQRALHFMEFFKTSHLPLIEENLYVGMLSDESILDAEQESSLLKNYKIDKEKTFVYSDEHIYEAVMMMGEKKLSLLAVIDRDENYLGTISPMDLIIAIAKVTSLDQSGSIIVLKMRTRDYSLSEIAQITEENQIKILSSYIHTCSDQHHIKLTLKLNSSDLTSIKASFERFGYHIEAVFSENQVVDDLHKDRLDELMHYLDI